MEEEAHLANSSRRILRLNQEFSFRDADSCEIRGPKPCEVYGFVGTISILVASCHYDLLVIGVCTI